MGPVFLHLRQNINTTSSNFVHQVTGFPWKHHKIPKHDSFSEFWPFRQTPKEFFSLFFFKARLGKPDLQRVIILYGILFLQSKPLSWPFYITRAINGLNNKDLFLDNVYRIILTGLFLSSCSAALSSQQPPLPPPYQLGLCSRWQSSFARGTLSIKYCHRLCADLCQLKD